MRVRGFGVWLKVGAEDIRGGNNLEQRGFGVEAQGGPPGYP